MKSWARAGLLLSLTSALTAAARANPDPLAILKSGRLSAALPLLEARAARDPDDAVSRYYLGFCLLGLQRFADAERELARAVRLDPARAPWLHALAKAQLERGKPKDAIATLERAIAIDDSPDYRFAKAVAAISGSLADTAERELDVVLDARPEHAEALFLRGQIAANRGDDRAALAFFRRCLAADAKHLEARYRKGLAERRVGDETVAIEDFEAVLHVVPGHVGALLNLGQALLAVGRKSEGQRRLGEFKRASALEDRVQFQREFVRLDPTNIDQRVELARLELEAGGAAAALVTLEAARAIDPTHRPTLRLLVAALERLGRHGDAASLATLLAEPQP